MPSLTSPSVVNQTTRGGSTFLLSSDSLSTVVLSCSLAYLKSLKVRISYGGGVSLWHEIYCSELSNSPSESGPLNSETPPPEWVDTDTINLSSFAEPRILEFSIQNCSGNHAMHMAGWKTAFSGVKTLSTREVDALSKETSGCGFVLDVPFRSQMVETKVPAKDVCLPTSLAMVCEFYGVSIPTAEMAERCFDHLNGIYGNWLKACIVAGELGLKARVVAFERLAELIPMLRRGVSPFVSVRYKAGDLTGAPVPATKGHLLVVRGIDCEGRVHVCDPAGPSVDTGRISYDMKEFSAALKGVAIVVEPNSERSLNV